MIVREPNGEPKLLMILAMARLCEAPAQHRAGICPRAGPRRPCLAENFGPR
jgi:hypothetical protein